MSFVELFTSSCPLFIGGDVEEIGCVVFWQFDYSVRVLSDPSYLERLLVAGWSG